MSVTISSATNTELEILYHALNTLNVEPKPIDIANTWQSTITSLLTQVKSQLAISSYAPRHWGGNEK